MPRFIKRRSSSRGSQPGSLIHIGEKKQEKVRIRVMKYGSDDLVEKECSSLIEAFGFIDGNGIAWINIDGLHDPEIISEIGTRFSISLLVLEDFMNTDHRPKLEEDADQIYIITKLLSYNKEEEKIRSDQLSLIVGDNFVISLQETIGTHFESVRKRIRKSRNRSRIIHTDYLAYSLLDCMVDNYIEIIAEIGEHIEMLDNEVLNKPGRDTISKLHNFRTEMNFLRKTVNPLKDICHAFLRSDSSIIKEMTREYIKDLYDHVITSMEVIESYQLMIMDQMNLYNSGLSNKANEIMKTLTVFAALFIPLTFLAGIYGMNFEIIPELSWQLGYLFFWIVALLLAGGLLLYFRKRKWF
ncbi:magnesium/cobalt transporter CorA [Bacteroidota bacterium]